jgi:HrpA-like RNA helicase
MWVEINFSVTILYISTYIDRQVMSKLPLLNAGNIVVQKWMSPAEKIAAQSSIPIEYIVGFVKDRLPEMKSGSPKIMASGPGERVLLLKSYTGSGKSMVPVYMHKAFFDVLHKNTVTTEPKVLTTIEITEGTVSFSGLKMEETIGYQTGQFHKRPIRGIVFMTTGVLVMQLKNYTDEELMKKYMIIIIDECHDRDVNNDMLMFLLKEFLGRNYANPACPMVILMSATFDEELFSTYFDVPKSNYIECKGLTYEVAQHFPETQVTNIIADITEKIRSIHINNIDDLKLADGENRNKSIRDIIVFCDTSSTIVKLAEQVERLNETDEVKTAGLLMPIYLDRINYGLGAEAYRNFKLPPSELRWHGQEIARRVIFTTTFAETGITIDGLKYCIDTGVSLQVNFNPIFNATRIASRAVSQDMAVQRRGRVGRKAPGVWYPTYTKAMFESMLVSKYPDILRTDISELLLGVIVAEYNKATAAGTVFDFDVTDLDIMGYPSVDSFEYTLHKLSHLGFVTSTPEVYGPKHGAVIPTHLGDFATKIAKMSLENSRMILAGYYWGANVRDLITIAAFTEVGWKDIMEKRLDDKYKCRNPLQLHQKSKSTGKIRQKSAGKLQKKSTGKQEQEQEELKKTYTISGACGFDQRGLRLAFGRTGWTEVPVQETIKAGNVTVLYMENGADKKLYNCKSEFSSLLNDNRNIVCDKLELYNNMVKYHSDIAASHMAKSYKIDKIDSINKPEFETSIVKAVGRGSYSGRGVFVAGNEAEFTRAITEASKISKNIMVSEYITNPMLFNGRKFHIRAYLTVLVHGDGQIEGNLWHRGKILTARLPYKNLDFTNGNIHDSHAKSTPNDLFFPEHLREKGINTDAIYEQMNKISIALVDCLKQSEVELLYPESKNAGALFGLDFMVTDEYVVKLLECNDKIGCDSVAKFSDYSPLIGPWTKQYSEFSDDFYEWYYNMTVAKLFDAAEKLKLKQKIKQQNKKSEMREGKYNKADLYFKLMWSDEFLEFLWLWYEILDVEPEKIEEWCADNGVKYQGLLEALVLRDEVIESLVAIGLNPMYLGYQNLDHKSGSPKYSVEKVEQIHSYNLPKILQINIHEGMEEIIKIKHCIFDGYKCNLAIWNGKSYSMAWKRLEIDNIESPLLDVRLTDAEQKNPRYIVCQNYVIVDTGMPKQTMLKAGLISIMDGFVNIDEHLFDYY